MQQDLFGLVIEPSCDPIVSVADQKVAGHSGCLGLGSLVCLQVAVTIEVV
jgi:hypothetical protein